MKNRVGFVSFFPATEQAHLRGYWPLRQLFVLWALLFISLFGISDTALAQEAAQEKSSSNPVSDHTLYLAEIQLSGASRTSLETVYRFLSLRPGSPVSQSELIHGVEELRAGGLFKTVTFYTRAGPQRGHLILVLEVEEHSFDFRWAAGNTDLDGWYLVPAMLAYDNPLGHGGMLDLQYRIGFRHSGVLLRYGQPRAGGGQYFWGGKLSAISTDQPYFSDGVEYRHQVNRTGLATVFGKRFSQYTTGEIGLTIEGVDAANHSTADIQLEDGTGFESVTIPEDELLPEIQAGAGKATRAILQLDWQYDTRSAKLRAGTPVSGIWSRLLGRYVIQDKYSHPGFQADLRAYREVPGGVLAARLRGEWVGENSLFYDRLYLGGMYSVRGFPTNSLSAPGGDTWMWSSSLEFRSRILGDAKGTKLAGVLFMDAGDSKSAEGEDPYQSVAVSAGYGLRLRVWWLDWIGLDVGLPVTERPIGIRFQMTASIGWSF